MSEDIPIRRLTWVPRSCRGSRWVYGRWQDSASARQAGNVCESTCPEQVANSHAVPIDLGLGYLRHLILCGSKPQLARGKRWIHAFRISDGPPDRVSQVTPVRKRGETVMYAQLVVNRPLVGSVSVELGGPPLSGHRVGRVGLAGSSRAHAWVESRRARVERAALLRPGAGGGRRIRAPTANSLQVDRYLFFSHDQKHTGRDPIPPGMDRAGAIGDPKVTGYADLSEGSDLSTFRVTASRHQQTGDPS